MTKPSTAAEGAAAPPPLQGREYRPIEGYPGYLVCSAGFFWSSLGGYPRRRVPSHLDASIDEYRPLKTRTNSWGYLFVRLRKPRTRTKRSFAVHRLVLEAFVGPRPSGQEARHIDGNKQNNTLSNLAWGTKKENADDKRRHGTMVGMAGEAHPKSKLTDKDVRKILELYSAGVSQTVIARRYHVSIATINRIITGKGWINITQSKEIGTRIERQARGSRNGAAKLTESDVGKILELFASGVTRRTLAARFQVSRALIEKIVNGTTWKHVPRHPPPRS